MVATGKGGTRSSVLDHRFGDGPPLTVGMEEEYMLLDGESLELVSRVEELLDEAAESDFANQLKPELMQCVLESGTIVCEDIAGAAADLRRMRAWVAERARAHGMRLGAAGTHPFSLFEHQKITARDRYRELVEMLQYIARRELVFGMHVHVAVPSPECCLAVMEGVLIELPVLLAMSANSPFWRGEARACSRPGRRCSPPSRVAACRRASTTTRTTPTRSASWRHRRHRRLHAPVVGRPTASPLRHHRDPRHGRPTRVEDTAALAAYVQCLVKLLVDRFQAGEPVVSHHRMLMAENKFLAARYGLDAPLMDLAAGKRVKMPARTLARRRLRDLRPIARELGCAATCIGSRGCSRTAPAPSAS